MFDLISNHLLTLMIFLPVAGAFILLFIRNADAVRGIAIGFALAELALCIPLLVNFNTGTAAMPFTETA